MNIIHIGPDSQFIQFISHIFEETAPGASRYIVTGVSDFGILRYPVKSKFQPVVISGINGLLSIPIYVRNCDMVIAHGMDTAGLIAFLAYQKDTVRVWSGWGSDYYGSHCDPSFRLLSEETKEIIDRPQYSINYLTRSIIFCIKKALRSKAAKKADYFSAPIPSEFEIFKKKYIKFNGYYAQLNYGGVVETFAQGVATGCGCNILVGNSASATNNYIDIFNIDIFNILSQHELRGRKVIVPLSYGDSAYRDKIINHGEKILCDSFQPLIDFLPPNEYRSVISRCNVVIMNQFRQQALGNIGAALYQGAHVFLNQKTTLFFLYRKKAIIHSVNELSYAPMPNSIMDESEMERNRRVLEEFWGHKKVNSNIENIVDKIGQV